MKKYTIKLLSLCLCVQLLFSGCAQMTPLSDEDEDKIVAFTTALINKFNKNQNRGIVPVVMSEDEPEDETTEDTTEEANSPDDTEAAATDAQVSPDGEMPDITDPSLNVTPNEDETTEPTSDGGESNVTDVVGIEGITFSYKGTKVTNDYGAEGGFLINPQEGNSFVSVSFDAINNSANDINCDISAEDINFTASLGGVVSAVDRTILPNDFTTYNGSIPAGASQDVALLFQFPTAQVSDLSGLSLTCIKGGVKYNIPLK